MKNITLLFCLFISLFGSLSAKDNVDKLQTTTNEAYSNNLINKIKSNFKAKIDPNNPYQNDVTSLLAEAVTNWSMLSTDAKKYIDGLQSGFNDLTYRYDSPSGYFRFYFTDEGTNAISLVDANNNGTPDAVEFYDECFTFAKNNYVKAGYSLPAVTDKYIIYISTSGCGDIGSGILGYCSPNSFVGDNPNSTETEYKSYKSFICIRSNFNGFGNSFEDYAQNTSCHEFFHAIQFGIDCGGSMNIFVMEGCAVWSQNWNYPNSHISSMYLYEYFNDCDLQLNYVPSDLNDDNYIRPYGTWVFFKYLTDMYGDEFIKKLYYNHISNSQNEAFENTLKLYGTDYQTVMKNFFISQFIQSNDKSKKPIYWSLAGSISDYLKPKLDYTFNLDNATVTYNSTTSGNQRFEMIGADYMRINYKSGANIKITTQAVTDTLIMAVIRANAENHPTEFDFKEVKVVGKNSGSIKLDYNSEMPFISLVIVNIKKANYKGSSTFYSLNIVPDPIPTTDLSVNDVKSNFSINGFAPFPATGVSTLNFNSKLDGNYYYNIFNIDGKLIEKGNFIAHAESNNIPFNFTNYYPGIYLLQMTNTNTTETKNYNFIVK